jgi:hypothetical protein
MISCPEGYYCPVATVEPVKCEQLEQCNDEGQRRFKVSRATEYIVIVLILSIVYLYLGKYLLNRRARRAKQAKLATKVSEGPQPGVTIMNGDDDQLEEVRHRSARRRSTLMPPDLTIDIEFERLSLTLPGVGTLMTGVTGNVLHGNLTAIMGPSGAGKLVKCF